MNEMETSQQSPAPEKSGTTAEKRISMLAIVISLLVALLVLALWLDVHKVRVHTQTIEKQVQSDAAAMQKSAQAFAAEAQERDQLLTARQETLEQGMQSLRDQLGRQHQDWIVAESDYLLRYAERRLLLERDVRGALMALRSVDGLFATEANPLYLPVRQQVRSEIQSLEALPLADIDGIALELSGLSKQVDTLPLAAARRDFAKAQEQQAQLDAGKNPAEEGWFKKLWRDTKTMFKSLVTVRRLDQKMEPMLAPEQRYFLNQNLRLRLEMARMALLRGDGAVYQENLKTATAWIIEYYDTTDAAVKYNRDTLARLAQVNIAPPLPEIGGSLRTLERIYEKQTGKKPAAATAGRSRQP